MDFIFEFIFEVFVEGLFAGTVKNPKVKTWVKTLVFLLMSEAVAAVFLWISYAAPQDGGAWVVRIIAIGLGLGFLVAAIHGHRTDWKKADY